MKRNTSIASRLPAVCRSALLLALGFGLAEYQDRSEVWQDDQKLAQWLNIASTSASPDATPTPASAENSESSEASASMIESRFPTLRFEEAADCGVAFVYENGPDDLFHLADTLGGGVAATDIDADGRHDLIFVNGGSPVQPQQQGPSHLVCFRQTGRLQFKKCDHTTGLDWHGYGHGCSVTDFNGDGFDDLLVTGYTRTALFVNQGDGTYLQTPLPKVTQQRWCVTGAWWDPDGDALPDLYLACYTDTPPVPPSKICEVDGRRIHCNPREANAVPDLLLQNNGNGTWTDQSEQSGISQYVEYGLGVVVADLNADDRPEIFVANDGNRNLLFTPEGRWTFRESALPAGIAYNGEGQTMGSMGIACADFDQNGLLDLLTTNFAFERNVLYTNLGGLTFIDQSRGTDVDDTSRSKVGWGAVPLDANLDGWMDLFIANGHVTDMPQQPFAQFPVLMAGTDKGLVHLTSAGSYFARQWHGRAACRVDLNHDGKDDLVVSHIDMPASVLLNESPANGSFITLRLIGRASVRCAETSVVEVVTNRRTTAWLYSRNSGYLSSHSDNLTISVPRDDVLKEIRIHWPGGTVQILTDLTLNRRYVVIEGRPEVEIPEIP